MQNEERSRRRAIRLILHISIPSSISGSSSYGLNPAYCGFRSGVEPGWPIMQGGQIHGLDRPLDGRPAVGIFALPDDTGVALAARREAALNGGSQISGLNQRAAQLVALRGCRQGGPAQLFDDGGP